MAYERVSAEDVRVRITSGYYNDATGAKRGIGRSSLSEASKKECLLVVDEHFSAEAPAHSKSKWATRKDPRAAKKQVPKKDEKAKTLEAFLENLRTFWFSEYKVARQVLLTHWKRGRLTRKGYAEATAALEEHDFEGNPHHWEAISVFEDDDVNDALIAVIKWGEDNKHRVADDSLSYSLFCQFGIYIKPRTIRVRIRQLVKKRKMSKRWGKSSVTYVLPGTFEFSDRVFKDRDARCAKLHQFPKHIRIPPQFVTPRKGRHKEGVPHPSKTEAHSTRNRIPELRLRCIQFVAAAGDIRTMFKVLEEVAGVQIDHQFSPH